VHLHVGASGRSRTLEEDEKAQVSQVKVDARFFLGRYRGAQPRFTMKLPIDPLRAAEAKSLTALAFRNGPIEDLHAGKACSACGGRSEFSHINDEEMKRTMKAAVNALYRLLWQRDHDPEAYLKSLLLGERYTRQWEDPEVEIPNPG
jgi:hypothetical protein